MLFEPQVVAEDAHGFMLRDQQEAVMEAVAELPLLQHLAVTDRVCGMHIGLLEDADELTRLEFGYSSECVKRDTCVGLL